MIDVFGQMWGTMIVNGLTLICTLTGICGVCIVEKIAIAVVGHSYLIEPTQPSFKLCFGRYILEFKMIIGQRLIGMPSFVQFLVPDFQCLHD